MSNRELVVLGTAGQVPTRARNHNGYFLRWDDEGLLFDPGEGTQRQMLFAGGTAHQVTRVCVTHFHGDHSLGLPGVLQRMALDQVNGRRMLPAELAARGITGADVGRLQRAGSLEHNGGVVNLADVSAPRRGQKFAFIMDTRLCDAVFELADDTDLLVCESTYADADADLAARYVLAHFEPSLRR